MTRENSANPFKNGQIQAVYVIHARKYADRADHMKRELARFDIPFEFIEPYDADMLDAEVQKRFFGPSNPLSPGQSSCALKHLEAMRRIAEKDCRLALVLEDDVVLAANFMEELDKIIEESKGLNPPFTIQIGCANNMYVPHDRLVPGRHLYEAREVRAAEAYLINAPAARKRVSWFDHNKIHLPLDHLYTFIDREYEIPIYWSEPTVVEQGSMNGLFLSVLEETRATRPLWYTKGRFWWQRLRKKYIYRFLK